MQALWLYFWKPRCASPAATTASSIVRPGGIGVSGTTCAGNCAAGNVYPPVAGAAAGGGGVCAATGVALAAVSTAGAAPGNTALDCCPAAQLSNSAGETVYARKRMLACDVPQYSLQLPLNACVPTESGVNQMKFVRFCITSRLPPNCGIQNEWMTSLETSEKFTGRPV